MNPLSELRCLLRPVQLPTRVVSNRLEHGRANQCPPWDKQTVAQRFSCDECETCVRGCCCTSVSILSRHAFIFFPSTYTAQQQR